MEMNKHFGWRIWSCLRHGVVVGNSKAVWLHCSGEATVLCSYMIIKKPLEINHVIKSTNFKEVQFGKNKTLKVISLP